jgi:AmiR/NasT family two-component response regulator
MEAVQLGVDRSPESEPDGLDALVDEVTQLHRALETRDVIGQAKGILMERHRLSAEAAFERLVHESQTRNRKLHDIARALAETGSFEP